MANTKRNQFLLEKVEQTQSGKPDPYTVRDGRFVGHDGFVVPKNFAEFYERFPRYVFRWVRKHLNTRMCAEAEDWTQELLLHLSCLPPHSKFRKEGKTDVIQTFNPERMHGANEARFRSFINRCLTNKFITLTGSRMSKPLLNPRNLAWCPTPEGASTVSDEHCHEASPLLRHAQRQERARNECEFRLREFTDYAEACCPGMASVLTAYRMAGTWEQTATVLNLGSYDHAWIRLRLRELGYMFKSGQRLAGR